MIRVQKILAVCIISTVIAACGSPTNYSGSSASTAGIKNVETNQEEESMKPQTTGQEATIGQTEENVKDVDKDIEESSASGNTNEEIAVDSSSKTDSINSDSETKEKAISATTVKWWDEGEVLVIEFFGEDHYKINAAEWERDINIPLPPLEEGEMDFADLPDVWQTNLKAMK